MCCVGGLSRVRCWDYCGEAPVVKAALSGLVHTCGRGTIITRSYAPGRKTRRLLAGTLLLPLALMALGIWEGYRGAGDVAAATLQRDRLAPVVEALQARQSRGQPGAFDMGLQFQRGGQLYGGPYAVTVAQDELHGLDTAIWLASLRTWLPPVVATGAGLAAALSALALLAASVLGRVGQGSREALLRGFSAMRRALPPLMGAQVVLMACAFVAAVAFEAVALLDIDEFSIGGVKLLAIGAVAASISLWTAGRAVFQLKRAVAAFTPDALPIEGRLVASEEAPGLWALLHELVARLGSLRPDNIVVGLTGGFFVSSGPKRLRPAGTTLSGRTLYLPLPALPLLRADEVAAVIAHELAHFSGGDTEWKPALPAHLCRRRTVARRGCHRGYGHGRDAVAPAEPLLAARAVRDGPVPSRRPALEPAAGVRGRCGRSRCHLHRCVRPGLAAGIDHVAAHRGRSERRRPRPG